MAAGRISAAEADRLLAAGRDDRLLRLAVALAMLWVLRPELHAFCAGVARAAQALVPVAATAAHHVLALVGWIFGGLL